MSPYVHNEIFLSDKPGADDADLYDRNRLQAGFSFVPVSGVPLFSSRIFYMVQHDLNGEWESRNIYGIDFSYNF